MSLKGKVITKFMSLNYELDFVYITYMYVHTPIDCETIEIQIPKGILPIECTLWGDDIIHVYIRTRC